MAATLGASGTAVRLNSVGDISASLAPLLGTAMAHFVFSVGVLGASLVAAIVSSLALAWGVGEVAGFHRSLENRPAQAPWFYLIYLVAVLGSAALVGLAPDLIWLNVGAQVLNAFMLPLVIGFLIALATRALPEPHRLKGAYLWILVALATVVCGLGLLGGVAGLL